VIAHVVLFRPRADLSEAERAAFIAALEHAVTSIPTVARARVGRRLVMGRDYDALAGDTFPFVAILEFEHEADLRSYLEHPAHAALGAQFYTASAAAQVFDFTLLDARRAHELL
jgi:uncharacterized protein (DUF1330 family)